MNLPIYIVSLKRDIERRNKINDVFHRLNINFDFFDAIDAKDPQNKEIIDKMRLSGVGAEMTDWRNCLYIKSSTYISGYDR